MDNRRKFIIIDCSGMGGMLGVQAVEVFEGTFLESSETDAFINVLKQYYR